MTSSSTPLAGGGRVDTSGDPGGPITLQMFDAAGAAVGPQAQVFSTEPFKIEPLSNGGYVFVGTQDLQYAAGSLKGVVFSPQGAAITNLSTFGHFELEASPSGGFLVTAQHVLGGHPPSYVPPDDSTVTLFDNAGAVVESAPVFAGGRVPDLSVAGNGAFVVTWNDETRNETLTINPAHPQDLAAPARPTVTGIDDVGVATEFTGGTTDDSTPTFRVGVSEVGHLGYDLARFGGVKSFSLDVTQADVARGYVLISGGPLANGDYTFAARMEDATGVVGPANSLSFTVAAQPGLSISGPGAHAEGNGGTTDFAFTITRSGDASEAAAVDYFVWGDQTDAADFSGATAGTARFAAGETSAVVHIGVAGDATNEADETFHLGLSNARGATISSGNASAVILNDDGANSGGPPGGGATGGGSGEVLTSSSSSSVLTGGAGNDTLNASQGYDTLTGGGGADVFAFGSEPWAPIHITDFTLGTDRLDLSKLFLAAGYSGSDPVGDHYVYFASDGAGGTIVRFDHDGGGPSPQWPNTIIDLEHVSPTGLTWSQLSAGAGAGGSGGSSGGGDTTTGASGQALTSPAPYSQLTGGAGADTLTASQGYDTLTGGAGADHFVLASEPWAPITIADFAPGSDKLDLRSLFQAAGYTGGDPVADHWLYVASDGAGGSIIRFDHDGGGPSPQWPNTIIELEHVTPAQLTSSDWIIS